MDRRSFLTTGALAALATQGFFASARRATAQTGSIFTGVSTAGFPDLDPATSFSNDNMILANCYETLTRYVPDLATGEGKVMPLLAESWAVSEDALTWTFTLREGVTFADGTPLTAASVKASIERTKKIGGGAAFIWGAVNAIEAPDARTVVMSLDYPQPMDLTAAAGYAAWIQSEASLTQDNAWFNSGQSAGTGPYTIVRFDPGQRCILKRNPTYWGGTEAGDFENVVLEVIEDSVLAQSMIESGTADWIYGVPYENLETLRANPALQIVSNPSFQTIVGLYNTARAPLDNPKVRQALSMAFPYDDLVEFGTAGLGTRAKGVIPPGIWGHDADAPVPATDLVAAKALIDAAGVAGTELTMTYLVGDPLEQLAGEIWKANLAEIGITLNLQPMAWEAQWQLGKSDPKAAQDIFVMYWWPTFVTPYDYFYSMFRSEDAPNFNLGYYKNPAFDAMIDAANEKSSVDRDAAAQEFIEAQRLLIADAAAVFMIDLPNIHILKADITGYVDNPAYGHVPFIDQMSRKS